MMRQRQFQGQEMKLKSAQTPIAIVGLACRLPGNCNTPADFWKFVLEGHCASCEVPPSRFSIEQHYDGSLRTNTMRSPGGMFINVDPKDLDAGFFALSQTDAISMDPNQRQLLEVVYEGLENAGLKLESLKRKKYGCFVGSYASDYSDIQNRDPENRTPSFTIGAGRAMLSNRISHFLDITGPSMTIDTACSGSLTSVDLACRYLDSGDADGAIVAGCNMYLNPEHNMEQSAMNVAASRTGRCWTFDARADGYIKAEAINTIILKRLDDAIRDGDPIRAVIRGSSTNSDGWTPGIANPSSDAQVVAIKRAYERAGISNFADTAYLECHGTGTLAGDPIEVTAASAVFAPDRPSPLRIGSVKSNIGHSEPAAGISGMLKMILSIENSVIPGNPTFEFPNPNIDFARLNVLPSRVATSWPFENMKRGSVNSFGFGGSNAHVIVEHHNVLMPDFASPHVSSYLKNEADFFTFDEKENNSRRVFVFSANDDISLKALTQSYIRHLSNPAVRVKSVDLAYTLSERRSQLFHRAFAISRDHKFGNGQLVFGKPRSAPPRIGFVFTGQGAQWSQMGRELLGLFSVARTTVTRLDRALNDLLEPPPWSLYNELIQQRTAEHMRSPEFSQPLVTALQLALFDVVSDLGLRPVAVIGHSSGEIAAAAVSGHLTYEEAIKVAYLRGKLSTVNSERRLGMLAVGLSETDVYSYIQEAPHVKLACINSPESVTLAGEVADLEQVQEEIQASGHFARHLQVDMAYHSDYMTGVAQEYLLALRWCCPGLGSQDTTSEVKFFSSVFGAKIHVRTDAQYWHDNMVRPVQFSRALESMVTKGGADTLVELGPSAALAGPISQTIESLQEHAIPVEYFATLSRGSDCMRPLYELMGKMFLAAVDINLMRLNNVGTTDQPRTIIDLPNYAWNHTTKYWHKPLSSIDWRFRKFPIHDLLGTKILGTSWQMPSWRRILRLRELPWLRDHRIGSNIIFPASGYIAMAVEAMFQTSVSLDLIEGANDVSDVAYGLRNVRLLRALVLEEDEDRHIYTFLHSTQNVQTSWYRFSIQSFRDGTWLEHADGLVQVRPSTEPELDTCDALASFQYPTNSGLWYKALDRVGLNFGPAFQNVIEYETCPGAETGRARLSWPREEDLTKQSAYTIHPTIIDAFFQAGCPAVFRYRTAIDRILVPKSIENITIPSRRVQPLSTIALTRCMYTGSGRRDSLQTRAFHAEVYNEHNGQVVFKISGLLYNEMEPSLEFRKAHDYLRLSWMPDVNALHDAPLESLHFARDDIAALAIALDCSESAAGMVSLVQHKTGSLSLLDFDMRPEDQEKSNQPLHEPLATSRFSSYVCISTTASNLARSRARMRDQPRCSYLIYDIQDERQEPFESDLNFDMIVLRGPFNSVTQLESLLMRAKYYATAGGFILLVLSNISAGELGSSPDGNVADVSQCYERIISTLLSAGLEICLRSGSSEAASSAFLCSVKGPGQNQKQDLACSILGLSDKYVATQLQTLSESLRAENVYGTVVSIEEAINTPIQVPIILLDHTDSPLLESVDEQRWHELQNLLKSDRKILYVSSGSEEDVMLPGGSLFTGLARTLRSEDPSLMIKTLELSCISRSSAVSAISHVLNGFENASEHSEREYYERRGLLYVSRLQRDTALIEADNQSTSSREVQKMWLHANTRMVRVRCSRIGTLDSLGYHEIDNRDNQLREDCIEIEIRAAALNFKDIATTMGLVVEDEYRLGSDGAGVVRQVGNKVKDFVVGDRVMFFCKGAFANRIQTEPERCLKISDTMSFEEAATIPTVYFTVVYALMEKMSLQKNQSILIHSAAGGVGIAGIQLSQYLGAKIYATVGSDEKRQFLIDHYGISPDNIFTSRSSAFFQQLMVATNGKGVDIVLNSLSGDLLAESWRCLADNGTLLEIGKKDIADKRLLPMESFNRNCTYRAIDIGQPSLYFDFDLIARTMLTILRLLEAKHIRPIELQKLFSFGEVSQAMKYMRKGTHIGKVVVSDSGEDIEVPVELAPRTFRLEQDSAYLLVGGLKGICGSLAVLLAQHGATELIVMSRSGADDDASREVLRNIAALGASMIVVKGDVTIADDVTKLFQQAQNPIRGIIQGAMVLRDSTFETMSCSSFHDVTASKVRGTWNLHQAAQSLSIPLQFFTLLSSISGIIGTGGQANYAAGNVFLDAFAAYRHSLGLRAHSINLGVVDEVGYLSKHTITSKRAESKNALVAIDERTLHKIVKMSILQQMVPIEKKSQVQMITGLPLPLEPDSALFNDARFCTLRVVHDQSNSIDTNGSTSIATLLQQMLDANAKPSSITIEVIKLINDQMVKNLGLVEDIEPAKTWSSYGIDSLAAVDLRNWMRTQLKVDLSTLDILNAKSLLDLAERVVGVLRKESN